MLALARPDPDTPVLDAVNDLEFGTEGIDFVLDWVFVAATFALLWLIIRSLARRQAHKDGTGLMAGIYNWLDPSVQALRQWIGAAPATFVYLACWTATTLIVEGTPDKIIDLMTRYNSTNLVGVLTRPVRSFLVSAFLVADNGAGFLLYVLVYVLIVARLEHRLGTPRTLLVWIAAHAGGSTLTVGIEALLIRIGWVPKGIVLTEDVGVSYVMVGSLGAYLFFISRTWRYWYWAALFIGLALPVIFQTTIWDVGHLLATTLGFVAGALVRKWGGARPRLSWRDLRKVPPRPLAPEPASGPA